MLAFPTDFQAALEAAFCRPVVVYELELAAGTLRYSSQALTWGGNAYTALAIEQSPIIETMGTRVPESRVVFTNITNVLRSQIEPVDLITNRRMKIRLLLRDSGGSLLAGSLVLMYGTMQQPDLVDENTFEVKVWGLGRGIAGSVPRRNFGEWCQVHQFADAVDCNYTSTTSTTGSGSATITVNVSNAQKFVDEIARIGAGFTVFVGTNRDAVIASATISPQRITLASPITFGLGDSVGFETCDRLFSACSVRARTHEFQGFRGIDAAPYQVLVPLDVYVFETTPDGYPINPGFPLVTSRLEQFGGRGDRINTYRSTVPVIYGRRRTNGVLVERMLRAWNDNDQLKVLVRMMALSEGEIDSIVGYILEDDAGADSYTTVSTVAYKTFGIFYRVGGIGTTDSETLAEYQADAVTQLRAQNSDYLSFIADRLSRTAYATIVELQPVTGGTADKESDFLLDVKGVKVQKYTNAASPTADGAVAMSANPLWQCVDILNSRRYGMGREVAAADIDFTVTKPDADVCDVALDGKVGTVSDHVTATKRYNVGDNSGFEIGMVVDYNGTNYAHVADEVTGLYQDTHVVLAAARSNWLAGDTITAKVPRYSSNIVLDRAGPSDRALGNILESCGGYLTYSVEGKIQLRVEQTGSSVAHYKDFGAAQGYQIVGKFQWLRKDDRFDKTVNRVFVGYVDSTGKPGEGRAFDHDHAETNAVNPLDLNYPNINNDDQAYRMARRELAKRRTLGNGARFMVGPIGLAHQPGDIVTVTHAVPNWTAQTKRVVRVERIGLGDPEDCLCLLTVDDYVASIYSDTAVVRSPRPALTVPAVTLVLDTDTGGIVKLRWGVSNGVAPVSGFSVYKSSATFAGVPDPSKLVSGGSRKLKYNRTLNATPQSYSFAPDSAEYGTTLYFIVQAHLFSHGGIVSNEITAVPSDLDPTAGENEPVAVNLIYGGDFNNAAVWQTSPPTYAADEVPPSSTPGDGSGYTSPANARDGNDATLASASVTYPTTRSEVFNLTGGSTVYGRWRVRSRMSATSRHGSQTFARSNDNGANYYDFATTGSTSAQDDFSSLVGGTKSQIKCRVTAAAESGQGSQTGQLFEVAWQETSTTVFSEVSGNLGTIRGNGAATYGEIRRPFPGLNPVAGAFFIASGDSFVTQLTARSVGTLGAHHLLVSLYNATTNTYYDLLDVDPASATYPVTATFQNFAARWLAPAAISGNLEIVVRSINSGGFDLDKWCIERATIIRRWAPNAEELEYQPDYTYGRPTGHNRGSWQTGVAKRSAVT